VVGRLFEGFEERVGRADRHAIRIVDQANLPHTDEGAVHDLLLDVANLLDLDLRGGLFRIWFDNEKVRMCMRVDLLA
jgi:hypothetical protein